MAVLPGSLILSGVQAADAIKEDEKQLASGKAAFEQTDYELASKHFLKAIDLNERNWEAHYLLGLILGQQGKYIASIDHEKKALSIHPGYAPAFSVLGRSLAGNQDFKSARYFLEVSCTLDPKSAANEAYLGTVLGMQKDFKAAYEAYKKAAQIDPAYVNGYLGMASCLGRMGDKAGQIAMTKKACEIAPRSAVAHAKLGLLLSESGDSAGAFSEGYKANVLRLQSSWNEFLGMFLTAWASVFLAFAAIFAVIFAGSKFKPQEDESLVRSFFLTFYKDAPGRFVVTDKRLVFVPESFSSWFGATRVSIQRGQIDTINYLSTVGGGTVSILTKDGSVHQFRMPLLVLDPLRSLLVSQGLNSAPPDEKAARPIEKSADSADASKEATKEASKEASNEASKEASKESPKDKLRDEDKPSDGPVESTIEIVFNAQDESPAKEDEKPKSEADKSESQSESKTSEPNGEEKKSP